MVKSACFVTLRVRDQKLGALLLHIFPVHHMIDMDLQNKLRSLRQSQVLWAHNLWDLWCAGLRHSAGLHERVILDGATYRLRELGDVRDVLGVLGVALLVPIVLRVLVSLKKE